MLFRSREFWLILFPLIIFFFVSLFAFSVPDNLFSVRASLVTASLSATLSYRYVIQNLAPKVEYAMFSDYMFFMFLILVFLSVIFNIFLRSEVREKQSGILVFLLHALLNITWGTLLVLFF